MEVCDKQNRWSSTINPSSKLTWSRFFFQLPYFAKENHLFDVRQTPRVVSNNDLDGSLDTRQHWREVPGSI